MRWVLSFFGLMFVIFLVLFFGAVIVSLFTVVGVARGAVPTQVQECVVHLDGYERLMPCEEAWLIRTDAEPPCLKLMEASMRERDAVDTLQKIADDAFDRMIRESRFNINELRPLNHALEEARGFLIVHWATTQKECYR